MILSRRRSTVPGCTWEARTDARQRLEVVLVIDACATGREVPLLTQLELQELLAESPAEHAEAWRCSDCGAVNDASRRWCSTCSNHHAGATA